MDCEFNLQKRLHEGSFSSSKHQRLEAPFYDENLEAVKNLQSLMSYNILDTDNDSTTSNTTPVIHSTNDSPTEKLEFEKEHSTSLVTTYADTTCSLESSDDFMSAKSFLDDFFKNFDFQNMESPSPNVDNHLQDLSSNRTYANMEFQNGISHNTDQIHDPSSDDFMSAASFIDDFFDFQYMKSPNTQQIQEPTSIKSCESNELLQKTCMNVPANNKPTIRNKVSNTVFHKELDDLMFLTLKHHNNQYYVYIKYNTYNTQDTSSKNGILMDIKCWYEFQYKLFAFNMKYQSSSFIANNTILVLNNNNLFMSIKNLKNYSHIELNENQLEKLKEMTCDLNKNLIHHIYTIHLPHLIKRKCVVKNITHEETLSTLNKLYMCIEENLSTVLKRIYECCGCILSQNSQSLHSCFTFNNREKFQQLGNNVLMLVNLDFVVCTFSNRVKYISNGFLCNIDENTIQSELFKALK